MCEKRFRETPKDNTLDLCVYKHTVTASVDGEYFMRRTTTVAVIINTRRIVSDTVSGSQTFNHGDHQNFTTLRFIPLNQPFEIAGEKIRLILCFLSFCFYKAISWFSLIIFRSFRSDIGDRSWKSYIFFSIFARFREFYRATRGIRQFNNHLHLLYLTRILIAFRLHTYICILFERYNIENFSNT